MKTLIGMMTFVILVGEVMGVECNTLVPMCYPVTEANQKFNLLADDWIDIWDLEEIQSGIHVGHWNRKFDLDLDGRITPADADYWLQHGPYPIGDSTANGTFDSADLVHVMIIGTYEGGNKAQFPGRVGWMQGDWNHDIVFDSSDFVTAMTAGTYETGALPAVAVPEPSALVLLLIGVLLLANRIRGKQ